MNKDKALESVNEIKELMEKSSRFVSLSGFTAIIAGIYALAGACTVAHVLTPDTRLIVALQTSIVVAALVFVASAITAIILSYYKSKRISQKFFSRLTYRALWHFVLPLFAGGVLCLSMLWNGYYGILSSAMLVFYGLAQVNVSKYSYASLAWLGYAFILLGIVDSIVGGHSLLFWSIGFGGFHIIYGILFYICIEKKK